MHFHVCEMYALYNALINPHDETLPHSLLFIYRLSTVGYYRAVNQDLRLMNHSHFAPHYWQV